MNLTSKLVLLTPALALSVAHAQAHPVHHTTAAGSGAAACSKLPEMSPKIPALPAGLPCAKPLYTITTTPAVKLAYVSPMEGSGLAEELGIETNTFSLDYVDVKVGTGELAPPHKYYTIDYTGYLVDGTKFDSSVDRHEPFTIAYGTHQVIPGWDTGFNGMHVGGKRRLYIPYQLAYGPNGKPGGIPPKAMLIFDVELLKVSSDAPKPKAPPTPPPAPPAEPAKPTVVAPPPPPPAAKPAAPATTPKPQP